MEKDQIEKKVKEVLIDGALDIDNIVQRLYDTEALKERQVKEAVQRLRYKGEIEVDKKWRMVLKDVNLDGSEN